VNCSVISKWERLEELIEAGRQSKSSSVLDTRLSCLFRILEINVQCAGGYGLREPEWGIVRDVAAFELEMSV
jgi:hypothetical protein